MARYDVHSESSKLMPDRLARVQMRRGTRGVQVSSSSEDPSPSAERLQGSLAALDAKLWCRRLRFAAGTLLDARVVESTVARWGRLEPVTAGETGSAVLRPRNEAAGAAG